MTYFTILHILALLFIFAAFVALMYFSLRNESSVKKAIGIVVIEFLAALAVGVFFMLIIDQYTKKAKIYGVESNRVLINETMLISGTIENIGGYDITSCTLTVKMINSPATGKLSPDIFKQRGFWDVVLFNKKGDKKSKISTIEEDFVIGSGLRQGERRPFSVIVPYPPNFERPSLHYGLDCH